MHHFRRPQSCRHIKITAHSIGEPNWKHDCMVQTDTHKTVNGALAILNAWVSGTFKPFCHVNPKESSFTTNTEGKCIRELMFLCSKQEDLFFWIMFLLKSLQHGYTANIPDSSKSKASKSLNTRKKTPQNQNKKNRQKNFWHHTTFFICISSNFAHKSKVSHRKENRKCQILWTQWSIQVVIVGYWEWDSSHPAFDVSKTGLASELGY